MPATSTARAAVPSRPDGATYMRLADELEDHLHNHILNAWYPRVVDKQFGGFGPQVRFDWVPEGNNRKFLVFQARLTWVAVQVAGLFPARHDEFLAYAQHGVSALKDILWDKKAGGWLWEVERNGTPHTTEKHVYGIAFGIYAAAAAARTTGDRAALDLAMRAFRWLDQHAHDTKNGGYFEALTREGKPILEGTTAAPNDAIGTRYGRKSMNAHIHLLEALTELYRAGHDPGVKQRLEEVFETTRDRIVAPQGYLYLHFSPDWTPIAAEDSYGHDVETAFLLLETTEALERPDDPTTHKVAKRLVDTALERGWDEAHGGFFDSGDPNGKPKRMEKVWWAQAEGMNALLLMHELHGSNTSRYFDAFVRTWQFADRYVADHTYGDWLWSVTPEGANAEPKRSKGGDWKDPYHQGRALMESIKRLRKLATRAVDGASGSRRTP